MPVSFRAFLAPDPRVTDPQLAFVFPGQGSQSLGMLADLAARHPSMLYEALLEGLVMLGLLLWFSSKPRPPKAVSGLFLLLYGSFRFAVEFVRTPDVQIGYLAFGWLTMGQLLSLPLVALGLFLLWRSRGAPVLQPQPLVVAEGKA